MPRAISSEPSRRARRCASSGATLAKIVLTRSCAAARRRPRRGCCSIALTTASATSCGRARADARRQLDVGVGEHAGVADEAGEHGRDADAGAVQVGAQRSRRSRAGRTSRRCRAPCPAWRPCPTSEEMNSSWPRPRASIDGSSACVSTIGARRLTSSARSISSTEKDSSVPDAGSAALATRMSTSPASASEALDLGAVGQIDGERRARRARRERLEHLDAPSGEDQLAPRRRARGRSRGRCRRSRRSADGRAGDLHAHSLRRLDRRPAGAVRAILRRCRAADAECEIIALFGPTGVGKTAIAVALAALLRERGERAGRGVGRRAAGVCRHRDADGRRLGCRASRSSSTGCVSFVPIDATFSVGQYAAARARRDRRAARRRPAPDRRRRDRAVSARGACRS